MSIFTACKNNDINFVKQYIAEKRKLNIRGNKGNTPLVLAIKHRNNR